MPQPGIRASLRIEFNLDADPIAGRVHGEDEESRPFCGWMELTRAIELGLAAARRAHPLAQAMAPEPRITDRPN